MTEIQIVPLETSDREQFISMSTAADSVTDKNGRLGFCTLKTVIQMDFAAHSFILGKKASEAHI